MTNLEQVKQKGGTGMGRGGGGWGILIINFLKSYYPWLSKVVECVNKSSIFNLTEIPEILISD